MTKHVWSFSSSKPISTACDRSSRICNGWIERYILLCCIGRAEYMRTCKEIIDSYFQVKFKAGLIAGDANAAGVPSPPQVDALNAVNHFAALGTYLANLRDDAKRERYSELSRELQRIVR